MRRLKWVSFRNFVTSIIIGVFALNSILPTARLWQQSEAEGELSMSDLLEAIKETATPFIEFIKSLAKSPMILFYVLGSLVGVALLICTIHGVYKAIVRRL